MKINNTGRQISSLNRQLEEEKSKFAQVCVF